MKTAKSELNQTRENPTSADSAGLPSRPVSVPGLCVLLFGLTLLVFLSCVRNGFIYLDDPPYLTSNTHVQAGLSWRGIAWAFTTFTESNWHPLTWISHLLDCQLFGLHPQGHHFTSVLLHSLSTMLLFLVFRNMTGATWRSFFLAALFGLHPLRVESVAWVSERKDVLSTVFFMLTLLAYAAYARSKVGSGVRGQEAVTSNQLSVISNQSVVSSQWSVVSGPFRFYLLALLFFALGLMSKPMLITLPFVLLLLDFWPLRRSEKAEGRRQKGQWGREKRKSDVREHSLFRFPLSLLLEKIPFFALAAASGVVTLIAQRYAMTPLGKLTLAGRVENALVSYSRYLGKLLWPLHLAVQYPYPKHWPWLEVVLSGLLLLVVSYGVIRLHRQFPWLATGWFWFLGTLIPVIGLVQVGLQSMADRYSYIPSIGILMALVWGVGWLVAHWQLKPALLAATAILTVLLCAGLTHRQIGYWKDTGSVFGHDLEVNGDNYLAYRHLAEHAFLEEHDPDKAIKCYQSALNLWPYWPEARNNLAFILEKVGRLDEAIAESKKAVLIDPKFVEARSNLGRELCLSGRLAEGINQYEQAIALKPEVAELHEGLADALYKSDRVNDALSEYETAARLKPDWVEPHIQSATLLCAESRFPEARAQCEQALKLNPNDAHAQTLLAAAMLETGQREEGIHRLQQLIKQNPKLGEARRWLGSAYYQQGRLQDAIAEYQQALALGVVAVDVQGNLGNALLNTQQFDQAIEHLQQAIRLKPDSFESHHNLGAALWSKGRFDEALREFEQTVKLAPASPEAHRDFAFALASQGRKQDAIDQLNEALKLRPGFAEAEQQLRQLTGSP